MQSSTGQRAADADHSPPGVLLPVDRSAAAVRAVWRLLIAVPLAGLLFVMTPDWHLLWIDDRATFLAFAVIWLALAVASLVAAFSTIRWALLAVWSGRPGVRISRDGITMRLGPFGNRRFAWTDIRIEYPDGFDADMAAQMPGDVVLPRLRHTSTNADVAALLMRFVSLNADELSPVLRPFISRAVTRNEAADTAPPH